MTGATGLITLSLLLGLSCSLHDASPLSDHKIIPKQGPYWIDMTTYSYSVDSVVEEIGLEESISETEQVDYETVDENTTLSGASRGATFPPESSLTSAARSALDGSTLHDTGTLQHVSGHAESGKGSGDGHGQGITSGSGGVFSLDAYPIQIHTEWPERADAYVPNLIPLYPVSVLDNGGYAFENEDVLLQEVPVLETKSPELEVKFNPTPNSIAPDRLTGLHAPSRADSIEMTSSATTVVDHCLPFHTSHCIC